MTLKNETGEDRIAFMDWQNVYFENDYITGNNLQIQYNLHQNLNDPLYRTRKSNPKIHYACTKDSKMSKQSLGKINSGDITILDLKLQIRTIITKIAWYCHKNRYKTNEVESQTRGKNLH